MDLSERILLVAHHRIPFVVFLVQQFEARSAIQFRSFFQVLQAGEAPSQSTGLAPLTEPPGPDALEGVDVVILYEADVTKLPPAFFERLAQRVKEGTTGLLVMPGVHGGAVLSEPSVGPLLPVAKSKPIEGQPVPGTFEGDGLFYPTEAGLGHPASRFVESKKWSEIHWQKTRNPVAVVSRGEKARPWGTGFCYPVTETKPGAVTLIEVEPPRSTTRVPGLIQGAPADGRVLWAGFPDFGEAIYYDPPSSQKVASLTLHWMLWLGGHM
jgi:hypothetical protein